MIPEKYEYSFTVKGRYASGMKTTMTGTLWDVDDYPQSAFKEAVRCCQEMTPDSPLIVDTETGGNVVLRKLVPKKKNMIKHGTPPYLECSSKGDKRFSAFYAQVNGQSIEKQYQAAKRFADGSAGLSWQMAKGKKCANQGEVTQIYESLWRQYIKENPELLPVLMAATGLSDMFGQPGHNCQATVLWKIRNEALNGQ